LGVELTTLPCKRENVEKPPRNSAGFCGGGQGLSWAVEPRKEEEEEAYYINSLRTLVTNFINISKNNKTFHPFNEN
jgi:hypothetical protein